MADETTFSTLLAQLAHEHSRVRAQRDELALSQHHGKALATCGAEVPGPTPDDSSALSPQADESFVRVRHTREDEERSGAAAARPNSVSFSDRERPAPAQLSPRGQVSPAPSESSEQCDSHVRSRRSAAALRRSNSCASVCSQASAALMFSNPIELLEIWKGGKVGDLPSPTGRHSHLSLQFTLSSHDLTHPQSGSENSGIVRSGDIIQGGTWVRNLVVHPDSAWHLCWIALQCILIGFDAVTIPLLVFDMPDTTFSVGMAWGSASFWILDMLVQCFVGFHVDGVVDMRPQQIWRRYVRRSLPVDLPVNMVDWSLLVLEKVMTEAATGADTAGIFRMSKASRAYRLLRLFRLLRLVKLMSTVGNLLDQMLSQLVRVVVRLVRLVAFLVLMVHYMACLWYLLGSMGSADGAPSWIQIRPRVEGASTHGELYADALHWTLCQFTPATIDIAPTNLPERVFAISVVFFVVIVFSSLVSSITAVVTFLRNLNSDKSAEEGRIQEYLTSRHISLALGNRVWHYFRQRHGSKSKRLHEQDVAFFLQLPEGLQMQLRVEAFMPTLSLHPIFKHYGLVDEGALVLICHTAVSEQCFWPGQEVYLEGTKATEMFWISSGRIDFRSAVGRATVLEQGQWVCEAALWCRWQHLGRAKAAVLSELVAIDAQKFQAIAAQRTWSVDHLRQYARLYAEKLSANRGWEAVDSDDFAAHREDVAELVNAVFKEEEAEANPLESRSLSRTKTFFTSSTKSSWNLWWLGGKTLSAL